MFSVTVALIHKTYFLDLPYIFYREKQKQMREEKKEKRKTQKGERRR